MPEGKPWTGLYTWYQEVHGNYYFWGSGSMQWAFKNKGKELKEWSTIDCPHIGEPYLQGKSYDISTKMMYNSEIFV